MYNTSQLWKQKIYENVQSVLNIYIDNVLIDANYILDFKVGQTLFNEELTLGSVSSKYIEFKIYKSQVPENMNQVKVDYGILINGEYEIIPIGIFNVDEWTDNDDNTLTIKCIDNMSKFEFNYDGSKLSYPVILLEILEDICEKAGVELGSTSFLNHNTEISVYDNTVTAREYLSYISECAGGFACIGRDGKLYIKNIYKDSQEIPLELFGEYKWGDKYKVSKVSYENGIESFKFGNETGNNIWLNQENIFIVDEEVVENIYDEINGLEAYSFEGKTIIDPALDVGDKILVDNKPIIYQGEATFQTRFIAEISSKIAIKQKQETTVREESQKVLNRRVQSRINEAEGKITQLVQETTENSEKISEVEQNIDGITQTVSSVEIKIEQVDDKADNAQTVATTANNIANTAKNTADSASSLANVANTTANQAKNTADNVNNNLTTNYYTKTQTNSQIQQLSDNIQLTINTALEDYSTVEETNASINLKANEVSTTVTDSITASFLTLLNNGYLSSEQVEALVEGNTEQIATIKSQLEQTVTDEDMQIAISTAIEGGVSYLKNTLFTINAEGLWIATTQDEFNAKYDNTGMYLYSYEEMIAKYTKDGAELKNLKVNGEIETGNLRIMDVVVDREKRTHVHWIGG